jgi:adenosylcobinamide-GDP ribazoletransferase
VSRGFRLAVSWLTVLPVGASVEVDRAVARRALYWAPVVGAGLGAAGYSRGCPRWALRHC